MECCKSSPANHKDGLLGSLCPQAALTLTFQPCGAVVAPTLTPDSFAFWQRVWSEGGYVAAVEGLEPEAAMVAVAAAVGYCKVGHTEPVQPQWC